MKVMLISEVTDGTYAGDTAEWYCETEYNEMLYWMMIKT